MTELNLESCDKFLKTLTKNKNILVIDFNLVPLQDQNFLLKIVALDNLVKQHFTFFAKSTLNKSNIYKILEDFKILPHFNSELTAKLHWITTEVHIYEDLSSQGYQNYESKYLNLDQVLLVLKKLANFHASGFAFEETKNKKLDREYSLLHLKMNLKTPEVTKLIARATKREDNDKMIETLEERQFSSKYRRTLCHGNLESKNLMFKNENGAPTDCKLINFKSNFYCCPIYDVLQLIFFNTSEDLRKHHFQTLLTHYFTSLEEEMKRYDLKTDTNLETSVLHFLPLVKLETALHRDETIQELEESLTFSVVSKEDCYVIVKNKLNSTNYELLSFKINSLSDVSGFLGEYHKLEIKIRHFDGEKTINCFTKSPPKGDIPKTISLHTGSFSREVYMYQKLVPQMEENGIDIIKECIPACYLQTEEIIVFDDLSLLNYQNLDALKPLNYTYLSMLIRKLAKFHACSLIFQEKLPPRSHPFEKFLTEPLFLEDHNHLGAKIFITGIEAIPKAVNLFPDIQTESNQKNFEKFWPILKSLFYTVLKPTNRFRNVICHGDLWTSNMMVKFEGNEPTDCILIDFQIPRYCPPAYDLLSVLHLTTNRDTRLKYEEELLKMYHEELRKILHLYGYAIDKVYPFEDLLSCVDYLRAQMVVQACNDCVLTMCTPEEISLFLCDEETCRKVYFEDRMEFMVAMCQKSELYKKRLKECILDIYDYCDLLSQKH